MKQRILKYDNKYYIEEYMHGYGRACTNCSFYKKINEYEEQCLKMEITNTLNGVHAVVPCNIYTYYKELKKGL